MKKNLYLLYGTMCYLAFLATIIYAIGFVGNFFVPKTIDSEPRVSLPLALLIDILLLTLFAFQHSVMARPAFKKWWTLYVPAVIERSTFVLLSSLCLMLLMWQWQPIGIQVWSITNSGLKSILMIAYLSGWAIVFFSTFLIDHFDLFGLRQVWLHFNGRDYRELPFRLPVLYQLVRHPLYLGFLIAFWATPSMTLAHLVFAIVTTGYILMAIRFEERDLISHFGEKYRNYKRWAPMLIPFTRRKTHK